MQKLSIKQLIIITLGLLVLVVGCMTIHQRHHFNKNVKIDNVSVDLPLGPGRSKATEG